MVPDKFNMVDMGGIDLIMMQGEEVPRLYSRLVESITQCRYQCLYNWLFDGIIIPPTYVEMEVGLDEEVRINEGVVVTSDDVIHIYSVSPPVPEPEIIPLLAEENGTYNVPTGVNGFNPVTVDVPSYTPVIQSITITENGTYNVPEGVDGFGPVVVNVPSSGELDIDMYAVDFNPASNANQAVSGGFSFRTSPLFSYKVTKIRVFARDTTVNAYISDSNGNTIASVLNASTTSGQWNDLPLQNPVTLSPNTVYVVWYSMPSSTLRYYNGIPTPASALVTILNGRYSTSRNTFPVTSENNTYAVDIFIEKIYKQ